ncbi:response regulator [Pelagibius sp. Alg239-R121]|uniref:response regulator n=1 Tax=Pelagibius sp. Alg239-R121 TaxID=2993448 RepID=UPI0024A69AE6|nr:response regulator [Pelagibius sp. Alg239-R121]
MSDRQSSSNGVIGRRVLVVDDDRDFADSLSHLLRLEGFSVASAYGASEALDLLEKKSVDVALIDIRMGERSGLDLVSDLGRKYPDIIAVLMTAYASAETAIEALQAGAYDYLCKPFFSEDLVATLERCFERINLTKSREEAEAALLRRNLELEETNARLRLLVESIQELSSCSTLFDLCRTAVQEVVRSLNNCHAAIYLKESENFIGKNGLEPSSAEIQQLSESPLIRQVLERNHPVSISMPADSFTPIEKSTAKQSLGAQVGFPLIGDDQQPLGVLAILTAEEFEISEQDHELVLILLSFTNEAIRLVRAREHLALSEERLREIIDNSPSLISLKDLKGRFLVVNGRFESWHGFEQEHVVGKTSDQLFSLPVARLYNMQFDEVAKTRKAVVQELDIPFSDGISHTVLATKFPVFGAHGQLIAIGTIATDISERKRTEERLRQKQKMEVLGQLTRGIAHDFNNLLAVISGNLDLIMDELRNTAEARELVEDAMSAAKSGAELTNRWLIFGRNQVLYPQLADAGSIVAGFYRMLKRTFDETIEIKQSLSEDLWPITIDHNQLETSLLNLAVNARDAMPNGGQLLIETRNISLEQDSGDQEQLTAGDYVRIAISDTGMGMDPDVAARALQPFFTTKQVGRGSGLGLSMVHGFVQQSGGHLEISSRPGKGTVVKLYLPRSETQSVEPELLAINSLPPQGSGERILVVEDRRDVRKTTKTMLTRLGYDVLEAVDGADALALLAEHAKIDLLFTDVVLPGELNGVGLARVAQNQYPTLKVICTSGYYDDETVQPHIADDEFPFVKKPFVKNELAFRVRQALDSDSRSSSG